ncbi:Lipopolysaccharide export system protein [Desulfonema magnum]|uniref:Lipopolysaccharide export system protein n=1 Tax=Desulfonema magnum TaxID=45655 RepID=A0A975BJ78_9BACT|nr:Lipopolysaccharide export system protein [Desulfonema magnum]
MAAFSTPKFKLFLAVLILVVLGGTAAIFVGYRGIMNKSDTFVSGIRDSANISIGNVHQTSTRNGVKEWILEAVSVRYLNEKKQAVFDNLAVTFFLKSENKVHLTGNKGILKTDSNDIEVTGNVVIKDKDCELQTEKLYYKHHQRTLSSQAPVKVTGSAFNLSADSMVFDLKTNKTVFEGNVKGTLGGNITM